MWWPQDEAILLLNYERYFVFVLEWTAGASARSVSSYYHWIVQFPLYIYLSTFVYEANNESDDEIIPNTLWIITSEYIIFLIHFIWKGNTEHLISKPPTFYFMC